MSKKARKRVNAAMRAKLNPPPPPTREDRMREAARTGDLDAFHRAQCDRMADRGPSPLESALPAMLALLGMPTRK